MSGFEARTDRFLWGKGFQRLNALVRQVAGAQRSETTGSRLAALANIISSLNRRKYDIIPGKADESILVYRLETDLPGARMPSLGRSILHEESLTLIRQWINDMPEEKSRQ